LFVAEKVDKQNIGDIFPLLPMQEGMLFHHINEPGSGQYLEQLSIRLTGLVDPVCAQKAWEKIVKANEILRSVFRWEEIDKPLQLILVNKELDFRQYDVSDLPDEEKETELVRIKAADREEGIELRTHPFRVSWCRMKSNECEMVITSHHILFDGWSSGIILKEFVDIYDGFCRGKNIDIGKKTEYKEYLRWLKGNDAARQEKFWQNYLAGFSERTLLPYDGQYKRTLHHASRHSLKLPDSTAGKISAFTRENGITSAVVFYCVWGMLLVKYCGMNDVVFGTTVSGRNTGIPGTENIVGLFINTIPFRMRTSEGERMVDLLRRTDLEQKERSEYERSPIVEIKRLIEFDMKENFFDSIVVVENYPIGEDLSDDTKSVSIRGYSIDETTNFHLTVGISVLKETMTIQFIYNSDLFREETIRQMAADYENILSSLLNEPGMKVGELPLNFQSMNVINNNPGNEKQDDIIVADFIEAENEIEINIRTIWEHVLEKEKISMNDNFFDIGGNSILLIRVHTKIEKLYPGIINGVDLFSYPTIKKLSLHIREKLSSPHVRTKEIPGIELDEGYFTFPEFPDEKSSFEFSLKDEHYCIVQAVCRSEDMAPIDLFCAVLIFMFSDLTGRKKISVQSSGSHQDDLISLDADIDKIGGFEELALFVKTRRSAAEAGYSLKDAENLEYKKQSDSIIPVIFNKSGCFPMERMSAIFDFAVSIESDDDGIRFACGYNPRLNNDRIRELTGIYAGLIENILGKYGEKER
jgi:hypothetical protein